jgi:lipoprotein NlpD
MNKAIFARCLVLPTLVGLLALAAGCTHTRDTPVRESNPRVSTRTPLPPGGATPAPAPAPSGAVHVVRQGETLYAVSRLYNIPVQNLIAWNNLNNPGALDIGQTLRIAPPGSETVATTPVPPLQSLPTEAAPLPDIKREPRGGKTAYSNEAWARLNNQAAGVTPTDTIPPTPPANVTPPASATQQAHPAPPASAPLPPDANTPPGGWIWPVKGTIIAGFDESTGDAKPRSRGIDISAALGTPVLASGGGKVAYAGSALRGLGNLVIIKHNEEYLTAYAHNRVILVKEGETVTKGQKIAELGNSDADRPKLHFELRKKGQPVDPLKYLPAL